MTLDDDTVRDGMPTLIQYAGEVVAVAGSTHFHLAPLIETSPPGDPVRAIVVLMCVFADDVRRGVLPGPYSDDRAQLFARCALIDDAEFASVDAAGESAKDLAERFNVPVEQIELKRRDLQL